jgi:starvation-inducible DNA-binding protein
MSSTAVMERKASKHNAEELSVLLADTYLLYVKSQNFHWNVVDPRFHSLHEFFEEQYKALADGVDVIAEQIRSLGQKTPASMREFLDLTRLEESPTTLPADEMLRILLKDHEAIIQWLRPVIDQTAKTDQGSSDMCIDRLRFHEKSAWMIKSHLTK